MRHVRLAAAGGLMILFGVAFLAIGAFTGWRAVRLSRMPSYPGVVLRLETQKSAIEDHDGRRTPYFPVVQFTTREGRSIDFTSATGSSPPAYTVGDRVAVSYDPTSGSAEIRSFSSLWLFPLVTLVFGGAVCGTGVALGVLAFRTSNSGTR